MHKNFETAGMTLEEVNALREKAARCRRLANSVDDRRASEALKALAEEYEQEARGLTPRH